jgi:catechol 2,3-dioxygenase-like lactoylglutathione lyase family enzyme
MPGALPVRLDHVVIHVSDWERSNWFYGRVLGAQLIEPDGSLLEFISYA